MYSDGSAKLGERFAGGTVGKPRVWRGLELAAVERAAVEAGRQLAQGFPELGEHEREDAVADARLRLLERAAEGPPPCSPRQFVCAAAVRLAARAVRQAELGEQTSDGSRGPQLADFSDDLIGALDLRRELTELRVLSSPESVTWQLKVLAGLPPELIAERMRCCLDTVYRRVRAASEKLTAAAAGDLADSRPIARGAGE